MACQLPGEGALSSRLSRSCLLYAKMAWYTSIWRTCRVEEPSIPSFSGPSDIALCIPLFRSSGLSALNRQTALSGTNHERPRSVRAWIWPARFHSPLQNQAGDSQTRHAEGGRKNAERRWNRTERRRARHGSGHGWRWGPGGRGRFWGRPRGELCVPELRTQRAPSAGSSLFRTDMPEVWDRDDARVDPGPPQDGPLSCSWGGTSVRKSVSSHSMSARSRAAGIPAVPAA